MHKYVFLLGICFIHSHYILLHSWYPNLIIGRYGVAGSGSGITIIRVFSFSFPLYFSLFSCPVENVRNRSQICSHHLSLPYSLSKSCQGSVLLSHSFCEHNFQQLIASFHTHFIFCQLHISSSSASLFIFFLANIKSTLTCKSFLFLITVNQGELIFMRLCTIYEMDDQQLSNRHRWMKCIIYVNE